MTTKTHNHLYCRVNWLATASPWLGEQASYGWRFAVDGGGGVGGYDRPALDSGQIQLNTFDCHTNVTTRALTLNAIAGSMSQNWTGDSAPPQETVTDNDIDFLMGTCMTFLATARPFLRTDWKLGDIKLYAVDSTGHSPLGPNTWTPTATYPGTASALLSPEVAACVSHYTAHRAKAGRGRFYVGPLAQTTIDTQGLFTSATTTALLNAAKAVQDAVRTRGTPQSSATYVGIVWNRLPGTTGAVINRIRVGDEPDRQERRTKSRPETFVQADVV